MVKKHGNYWLDIIELEKYVKKQIIKCADHFIGKTYFDSLKMKNMLNDEIENCLDEIVKQEKYLILNVDYELELDYENNMFIGYKITNLCVDNN